MRKKGRRSRHGPLPLIRDPHRLSQLRQRCLLLEQLAGSHHNSGENKLLWKKWKMKWNMGFVALYVLLDWRMVTLSGIFLATMYFIRNV
jgi:hypothetical protein